MGVISITLASTSNLYQQIGRNQISTASTKLMDARKPTSSVSEHYEDWRQPLHTLVESIRNNRWWRKAEEMEKTGALGNSRQLLLRLREI